MKISLITIHNSTNYGAVLQAYATKVVLSRFGEVTTINYQNEHLTRYMKLTRFSPSIHGLKMFIHDVLRLPQRYKTLKLFKSFINNNMNLSNVVSKNDLLNNKIPDFDVYVCGSDQIWNPDIVSYEKIIDPIFFLSFAPSNAKKISYASSIGHHKFSVTENETVKKLLNSFNSISVREKDGVNTISNLLPNKKVTHVLDPSLLLSKEEWLSQFNVKENLNKEKYILVYTVPRTELLKKAISYFSNKLNLKVVAIDTMLFPVGKVDSHIKSAGVKDFIEFYANASFVITDSFHGTCFALNFGKPFVSISANERANRAYSLLDSIGMIERLASTEKDFSSIDVSIDEGLVNKRLKEVRETSLSYINDSILN